MSVRKLATAKGHKADVPARRSLLNLLVPVKNETDDHARRVQPPFFCGLSLYCAHRETYYKTVREKIVDDGDCMLTIGDCKPVVADEDAIWIRHWLR